MLAHTRWIRSILLAIAVAAPARGEAGETGMAQAAIGDLILPFDPRVWKIEGESGNFVVRQADDPRPVFGVSIAVASADKCSQQSVLALSSAMYEHAWERHATTVARPGFDLHIATLDMGCRNWTGSPVFACAAYKDKVYSFIGDPGGCRTPPNYDGPIIELLGGLKAAP